MKGAIHGRLPLTYSPRAAHTRRVLLTLAAFAFLVVTFVFAAQPLGATMVCPDGQGQAAANACGDALQANVELMEFAGAGVDPLWWTPDPGMRPGEGGPDGSSIEVSRGVPA